MSNPTNPFSWQMPTATDLVTDLPADFEVFGQAVATSLADLLGGTTGQVLKKNTNADMDFVWSADSAGMTNPMTTTGDTIYSSSGSTPARLGIGSTGNVLTVAGGVPTWAAPAGGMTTITSGSFSGASVSLSSFGGYKSLRLVISNWRPATANAALRATINSDSGTRYLNERDTSQGDQSFAETSLRLTQGQSATTYTGLWIIDIPDYTNTTTWKIVACRGLGNSNATPTLANTVLWTDFFNQIGAITTLQLFPSSGNHTSGDYVLYGVN